MHNTRAFLHELYLEKKLFFPHWIYDKAYYCNNMIKVVKIIRRYNRVSFPIRWYLIQNSKPFYGETILV